MKATRIKNSIVILLFKLIWHRRLVKGDQVIAVCGWRTCVIETMRGERKVTTMLLNIPGLNK